LAYNWLWIKDLRPLPVTAEHCKRFVTPVSWWLPASLSPQF
jgi:hypothetical protein